MTASSLHAALRAGAQGLYVLEAPTGRFLPEMVTNARLNGHSWDEIARAIGTSPEEAHLRFDPESPVADSRWPYDF
jgi:hypothetical protein